MEGKDPANRGRQRPHGEPQAARALRALDAEAPADGGRGMADLAAGRGGPAGHGRPRRGRRRGRVRRRHRRLHGGRLETACSRCPLSLLRGGRRPGRGRRPTAPGRAPGGGQRLGRKGRGTPRSPRQGADIVVSSLPFSTLPAPVRHDLLDAACEALAPGGVFLVLQYSKTVLPELERRFPKIRHRFSPLNVPPAFLFACEAS